MDAGEISGRIVTIDRFGNLITNVDAALLRSLHQPALRLGPRSFNFVATYSDTAPGEYCALINAFGVVELACCQGNAATALRAGRGTAIRVYDQNP